MLKILIRKREMSLDLQIKVFRYFEYMQAKEMENNEAVNILLSKLTGSLKEEVFQDIYGKVLKKSRSFNIIFSKQFN